MMIRIRALDGATDNAVNHADREDLQHDGHEDHEQDAQRRPHEELAEVLLDLHCKDSAWHQALPNVMMLRIPS